MPAPKKKASAAPSTSNAQQAQNRLVRLGLRSDMDLALHLPLRYEDETQIFRIHDASLHGTRVVQVEGIVTKSDIQSRPRRQLVVTIADDSGALALRFLNFYGSQARQLAEGVRVRARGELRHGFCGAEIVHPTYKIVLEGAPLPTALTPVYPAGDGLPQAYLRKAIAVALTRIDWRDTLPQATLDELQLASFASSVRLLHNPPADVDAYALEKRSHPAWIRMKFDELLAQQLSMRKHYRERKARRAPVLEVPIEKARRYTSALIGRLPFQLTRAQQRTWGEIEGDLARPHPMHRLLQGDVG
ncbi:MAG TPA: ATP-dependent DNA helicase RecG, partial [Herbaspirillum sp.]|nr:ATP-dependent DNA helicase RecG [Herbaspirillum sp.]